MQHLVASGLFVACVGFGLRMLRNETTYDRFSYVVFSAIVALSYTLTQVLLGESGALLHYGTAIAVIVVGALAVLLSTADDQQPVRQLDRAVERAGGVYIAFLLFAALASWNLTGKLL